MNFSDMDSEVSKLRATEEGILASFTQRLIEIAAIAGAHESGTSPTAAHYATRLPAIALDQNGFVVDVNAAADAVFDNNIKIRDRRIFVSDADSRRLLKEAIDQLKILPRLNSLVFEPVIVRRMEKLPVIVRILSYDGPAQEACALLTLNALGPRPGPSAAIIAKTFRLTASEAKVACIIARGASPYIAARELKISRESARNQLKSVFAKTDTHRQSELVALLLQVE
jgi:DNA-binding CsgD family transcriptional regulator